MSAATDTIQQRQRELQQAAEDAERAARIEHEIAQLRRDVAATEVKRDRLAALGDRHVEIQQSSYHQGFGMVIEYQALRSLKTGKQLAKVHETRADELRAEISKREAEIAELLASGGTR